MAWRRPGDKPLSEPMMVRLPTHICVTRPQWVNKLSVSQGHTYNWRLKCLQKNRNLYLPYCQKCIFPIYIIKKCIYTRICLVFSLHLVCLYNHPYFILCMIMKIKLRNLYMGAFYDIIIDNIVEQMIWFYNFGYVLNVLKWSQLSIQCILCGLFLYKLNAVSRPRNSSNVSDSQRGY